MLASVIIFLMKIKTIQNFLACLDPQQQQFQVSCFDIIFKTDRSYCQIFKRLQFLEKSQSQTSVFGLVKTIILIYSDVENIIRVKAIKFQYSMMTLTVALLLQQKSLIYCLKLCFYFQIRESRNQLHNLKYNLLY